MLTRAIKPILGGAVSECSGGQSGSCQLFRSSDLAPASPFEARRVRRRVLLKGRGSISGEQGTVRGLGVEKGKKIVSLSEMGVAGVADEKDDHRSRSDIVAEARRAADSARERAHHAKRQLEVFSDAAAFSKGML